MRVNKDRKPLTTVPILFQAISEQTRKVNSKFKIRTALKSSDNLRSNVQRKKTLQ